MWVELRIKRGRGWETETPRRKEGEDDDELFDRWERLEKRWMRRGPQETLWVGGWRDGSRNQVTIVGLSGSLKQRVSNQASMGRINWAKAWMGSGEDRWGVLEIRRGRLEARLMRNSEKARRAEARKAARAEAKKLQEIARLKKAADKAQGRLRVLGVVNEETLPEGMPAPPNWIDPADE